MTSSRDEKDLNLGAERPKPSVMRGRIFLVLGLAILGICLGVVGAVFSNAWLSSGAGILGVVACLIVGSSALLPLMAKAEEESLESRIDQSTRQTSGEIIPMPDESVIDEVTDLPDARFFEVAVEGRVAAARRHLWPVSIVLVQIGYDPANNGVEASNRSLASFANLMRQTLREADIACRIDATTFGLILEDTSEEGGVWTAERLQIALSHDNTNIRRLVAGVAAYPTHGLFAKDVMVRAQAALNRASSTPVGHGLGQVEVAHVDLS